MNGYTTAFAVITVILLVIATGVARGVITLQEILKFLKEMKK